MDEVHDDIADDKGLDALRERVDLTVGALVQREDAIYRVSQVLDFDSVIGVEVESGRATPLRVRDLRPVALDEASGASGQDLARIADESWQEALERYRAIEPFAGDTVARREDVAARAAQIGVSTATLYRWIKRYRSSGLVTSLIKERRGWRAGASRLAPETDAVIDEVIESVYLQPQRSTQAKAVLEVKRLCHERGVPVHRAPAPCAAASSTSTRSVACADAARRSSPRTASVPPPGKFPNADFPLAVVQIDHTEVDIILVDDTHRRPVGRPWLTFATDVYSRMITGYYLSFDPPSATSVGLCVAHSVLPKEEWLTLHGVEAQWPVWGFPRTIHVDNGADFRSQTFERSCLQYGINLEFRPVRDPRKGGHVERLLRHVHAGESTTCPAPRSPRSPTRASTTPRSTPC